MSLIITRETRGNFERNDYIIGSTISSFLLPIINLGNRHTLENNESIYYKPLSNLEEITYKFKLIDFMTNLNMRLNLNSYAVGKNEEGDDIIIRVGKGYIVDENDNILLLLGLTDKGISNFDSQIEDRLGYYSPIQKLSQYPYLCLLISTKLITDEKYSSFYKKLEKYYINDFYKNDIEVRFITSEKIEKLSYDNEFKLRFNTIEQLQSHLQNSVPKLMFLSDSDYANGINPGLNYPLSERNAIYVPPVQEQQDIFPTDALENKINSLNH